MTKKMGRPPEAVPAEKMEEILQWIAHGKPLREYCRIEGNPAFRTVYDWIDKNKDFAARFACARDVGADVIAEEALEIIDTFPIAVTSDSGTRLDSAHVAWLKNRAEMRLKLLAKWNPKKYGDKTTTEVTGADGGAIMIDDTERAAKLQSILAAAASRKNGTSV
jgi:hypothetical protein